ncbi:hsp90 co-chaperone Cdc37 isoform X2 [Perca flavescens]|uniref:hsp90 co-chaperone Cdc37 isoform X2 n=1 Tax=Perca flavescens TaxID=8167 RepID=UPI00106E1D9B|nr:hsp90 co-chaperone Cdc37-like isoform X2 [Perca flavescens]
MLTLSAKKVSASEEASCHLSSESSTPKSLSHTASILVQSILNIKPVTKEETEEEKVEKHKTFAEKYKKEIRHFGMLRRWDDSQKYLSDNPHLVCEETANCLVVICIDFEIDEKHALMEQVAHQAIVLQFILDLARTLKVDARGCFRQFFSKIQTADKPYLDEFDRELERLKERIRSCAQMRMASAVEELEEEERQKRLGPGGLDPVEVYESLPKRSQYTAEQNGLQQSGMSSLCARTCRRALMRRTFRCCRKLSANWTWRKENTTSGDVLPLDCGSLNQERVTMKRRTMKKMRKKIRIRERRTFRCLTMKFVQQCASNVILYISNMMYKYILLGIFFFSMPLQVPAIYRLNNLPASVARSTAPS